MPEVSRGSSRVTTMNVDLLGNIEHLQGYLLIDSEGNFLTNPESVTSSLDLLETFCDRALQSGSSPWESTDVLGFEKIRS